MARRAILGLFVIATLVGCASRAPVTEAPAPAPWIERIAEPPAEPLPDPSQLYLEMNVARVEYSTGIELLAAGDEVNGEETIARASGRLMDAASACAEHPDCDVAPFLLLQENLLEQQSLVIKQQSYRLDSLEQAAADQDAEREAGVTTVPEPSPDRERSGSLLRGADFRQRISLNGPVEAAIDDWLTWLRPNLMQADEYYQFLRPRIAPIYDEAGLPEALLFGMIATESGGKAHAYSSAGAAGLLQFMRHTGRRYGLVMDDEFDLRLDPEASTRANVAYLAEQLEEFDDNLELALAAYNGGEARVATLHRRYPDAGFWDNRIYYSVPRETREYVPRVLAAAWLFLHPDEYGLEFPSYEVKTTTLVVQQDIALGELTICLGQDRNPNGWFRTLRNLNPRLEPGDRIEAGTSLVVPTVVAEAYEDDCLGGALVERARELHDANYPEEPEMIYYTVRSGDTLGRIASRFRCATVSEIAAINRIRPPRYIIRPGQQIKIPPCP